MIFTETELFLPMEKKTDFKALSNKAKVQYIWDYYKLRILVIVLCTAAVISLIHHYVTYREPLLNVLMINTTNGDMTTTDGFDEFLDAYGYDKKESPVSLYSSLYIPEEKDAAISAYQDYEILATMIAAGDEDIFFGTGDVFLAYAEQGAFTDLSHILSEETFEKYKDNMIYSTDDGESESYPCAIEITDNEWLKKNGYYDGSCYFGIFYRSENTRTTAQFAEFLLAQ